MTDNIYQRLNAVRKQVEYVQKDASVGTGSQTYMAVTHDMVTAATRDALIEHGVMVIPSVKSSVPVDKQRKNGNTYLQLRSIIQVAFVNVDNPEDKVEILIESHADDSGDKAPGKALSYAVKYALLKVLSLETGEDDESRMEEERRGYSAEEKTAFDGLLAANDDLGLYLFRNRVGQDVYISLYNSGEKGKKVKLKERCQDAEKTGAQMAQNIRKSVVSEDITLAAENMDGLTELGYRMLLAELGKTDFLVSAYETAKRDAE